jgi:hypothetical protein
LETAVKEWLKVKDNGFYGKEKIIKRKIWCLSHCEEYVRENYYGDSKTCIIRNVYSMNHFKTSSLKT